MSKHFPPPGPVMVPGRGNLAAAKPLKAAAAALFVSDLPAGDASVMRPAERLAGRETAPDLEAIAHSMKTFGVPCPIPAAAQRVPASAKVLGEVQRLREHHLAKGHSPETDSELSPARFIDVAETFIRRAREAKTTETRRKNQITAIGALVAWIDAEDYLREHPTQEEQSDHAR